MCLSHRTLQGYTIGNRANYQTLAMDILNERFHLEEKQTKATHST